MKNLDSLISTLDEMERHPETVSASDKTVLEKIYGYLVKSLGISESAKWAVETEVKKYADREAYNKGFAYETRLQKQNIVVDGGAEAILKLMCGTGDMTAFSSENAHLGVGSDNTAENVGQVDLQAASEKLRKKVDGGYPTVSGRTAVFKATFNEGEANFAWKEFAIFNANTGGTMLNRRVSDFGTKANGIWSLEIRISVTSNA